MDHRPILAQVFPFFFFLFSVASIYLTQQRTMEITEKQGAKREKSRKQKNRRGSQRIQIALNQCPQADLEPTLLANLHTLSIRILQGLDYRYQFEGDGYQGPAH